MTDEAHTPDPARDNRLVVVLNKRYEVGRLLNALGHAVQGLAATSVEVAELDIQQYYDADGTVYPNISFHPVIVLKADNGSQLRRLRQDVEEAKLPFTVFVDTMIEGGTEAQLRTTRETPGDELDYVAVCAFGPTRTLKPLTRRFRLFT